MSEIHPELPPDLLLLDREAIEAARRCGKCGTIHPGRDAKAWHAMRSGA